MSSIVRVTYFQSCTLTVCLGCDIEPSVKLMGYHLQSVSHTFTYSGSSLWLAFSYRVLTCSQGSTVVQNLSLVGFISSECERRS